MFGMRMIGGALAGLYPSVNALTAARRTFSKRRHASSCRSSCVFDVLVLLSLFCLSVCFSSCSNGKKRYVIGVSQCSEDIWRNKLNNELRDAVYVHENVELSIKSADDEDEKQAEQINRFVDDGVDILIVAPNQVNSVTKPIAKAYGKGIPVIFFDRRAGDSKYTAFIGGDNVKIGRTIGEYIASKLGGKGTVAEIMGLEGSSPAIERHKGFIEALSKYPGIRLVASQSGTWQQESGRRIAEGVFAGGVRPDYVFAHNDRMAFGAWQVARRLGLGDKIKFVGIDALPGKDGGIRLVRDGVLDASYIYPTRGDLVIQLALNILEGRPYKKDNYMKAALVTKDNAETMLMQAEEISHMSSQLEELHGKLDFFFTQYSHQKIYFMLSIVILVLVLVVFVISYRMAMVKRRMEREAADSKLAFFTDISHDLRTPLTLIADPVERILDDDNITPAQRQMLGTVKRNAATLLNLVSEILDLRKIQDGKMTLALTEFNLCDSIRMWVDDFKSLAAAHKVTIGIDAGVCLNIKADYNKVERICYNLISNALKYNRQGGCITVKVAESGGYAEISVADTGIGMSKDSVGKIFDKFYRVENNSGGTGVGLAVVKAFVELHGGNVSVDSVEGKGSEFVVRLPLNCDAAAPEPLQQQSGAGSGNGFHAVQLPVAGKDGGGEGVADGGHDGRQDAAETAAGDANGGVVPTDTRLLVLIVDDNIEVRQYVASILHGEYDVILAANGKEGLDIALKNVPDVIICDVLMPVMDGLEMCRRVKEATATSHVPVILLTSQAFAEQRAEGYDCGADAYITKPFSSKVLVSRVRNLLENRKRLKYVYGVVADNVQKECGDVDSRFMDDFRRVVEEYLADSNLTVETVSAALNLSRVQMYRKVKQLTGSSPVELIRVTRLKRAEHLLKTTNMTVSEISYEVGFSSPSYFSKCFKDHFGTAPGDIR